MRLCVCFRIFLFLLPRLALSHNISRAVTLLGPADGQTPAECRWPCVTPRCGVRRRKQLEPGW